VFPPARIVCLTEETVETLYLLGEQDRIVGISGYVVRPPQARREKPRVSAFISANIDEILALKPDLVLSSPIYRRISSPISFAVGSTSMPSISEASPGSSI
jgi:ABC-type Fe3+-hydroxamate transport system substrate-binding protein